MKIAPTATYRLQFRDGMDFAKAATLAPYLVELGISHLYASPVFQAATGSTHGYDVIDHDRFDPALGGSAGFEAMCAAFRDHGIGLILDIVPNHMAATLENPWWASVVSEGETSPWARHFDIDWSRPLTLPFLGSTFEEAAARGELKLVFDPAEARLTLGYFGTAWPLSHASHALVLDRLPQAADPLDQVIDEWAAEAEVGGAALRRFDPADLDAHLETLSADPAFLADLHAAQHWRLAHWTEARRDLSYRRFFEIAGLAGVRVEDAQVFDDVHRLALDLVHRGVVDGLRIDHVDGLADPAGYLRRLREQAGEDCYIVVEKILAPGEGLPAGWPVDGTTGYEFIDALADVFADETRAAPAGHADARRAAKQQVLDHNFEGELTALSSRLHALATAFEVDASEEHLRRALAGLLVAMPVYRTYGVHDGLNAGDRALLLDAARDALEADQQIAVDAMRLVCAVLVGAGGDAEAEIRRRFQQLAGPAMAKGVEDTLFYRENAVLALNEVGGDPGRATSPERFHDAMARRAAETPRALNATATHDTKRGEDARARLFALAEDIEGWSEMSAEWYAARAGAVADLPDGPAPEPAVAQMIHQALAGCWPEGLASGAWAEIDALRDRFLPYVEKALREAKLRTSWDDVNEAYEAAVRDYAASLFADRDFIDRFVAAIAPYMAAGRINSLAQTVLKLTAPGIPDIYQGSEASDFSLVDPDNRRPRDFSTLAQSLANGEPAGIDVAGLAKQALIARLLRLRREQPALFSAGNYTPLETSGPAARHLIAFAREHQGRHLVVAVPRLPLRLIAEARAAGRSPWQGTEIALPEGLERLVDVLDGTESIAAGALPAAELFHRYPVAILTS